MNTDNNNRPELFADKLAFWLILIIIFLAPLFFIPTPYVPFQFAKVTLLYIGVAIALCACIIARLKDGVIRTPANYILASLFAIPVIYVLSALLSPARGMSLMGEGFEIGTASFIAAITFFALFIAYFFTTKGRVAYAYAAFLIPVPIVILYQLIRLLAGPGVLSFGVLTTATSSLLGGWNDLGIYFGAVALFAFLALELLTLERWLKILFGTLLVLSLFFLTVINFTVIWYLLAALALIFFVYNFSFTSSRIQQQEEAGITEEPVQRSVPVTSFIIIIISVIFILLHGNLYSTIPFLNKFAINNIEVSPSWSATFQIIKQSLRAHPIFGIGPNRFAHQWFLSKPAGVNSTIFWNSTFNYGIGLLPTFIATTGILGTLSWLAFLVFYLIAGFKALFVKTEDSFLRYVSVSSFILSLYFLVFTALYVPSAALLIIGFAFIGIFLATLPQVGLARIYSFNFVRDPKISFASVLVFIVLILGILAVGYTETKKFIAAVYFNKAIVAANVRGDAQGAESNLVGAIQLSQDDQFYRTLSALYLQQMSVLVTNQSNASQDVLQNKFRSLFANAQAAAQAAVNLDKTNYANWLSLGDVYASVVPLNIQGAYESAQAAYAEAAKVDPQGPEIPLTMARLEVARNNLDQAKQDINQALQLKNDYTDAILLLSQIQATQGDLQNAIQSAQALTILNPNDTGAYFELGLLRYDNKDYTNAAPAFEQAIALAPDYANAKYFLGLTYNKLGKTQDAIKEFQDIKVTNPNNQEVDLILANLRAGRDPFANVKPPLDNKPEKRANPPVSDTTQSSSDAQAR